MIPTILYLLLRRIRQFHPERAQKIQLLIAKTSRIILLIILSIAISGLAFSQENVQTNNCKINAAVIDNINQSQITSVNICFLK